MTKPNIPALRADAEAFLKGSEQAEGGRAALSLDMVAYLGSPIVHKFKDKDGTEYTDDFVISDLVMNKPRNDDGSASKTVQGHRRVAAIVNLFGFESYAIPDKINTAMDKLVPEAIALRYFYGREDGSLGVRMVKVPGDINKTSRRVVGGIPAADMFELVDDAGNPTALAKKSMRNFAGIFRAYKKRDAHDDAELLQFMLAYDVEADGRKASLFDGAKALTSAQFLDRLVKAAREAGALPPIDPRDRDSKGGKGLDLKSASALVLASLDQVLGSDESDTVFSPELESVLDQVAERWAAYRSAFPRLV